MPWVIDLQHDPRYIENFVVHDLYASVEEGRVIADANAFYTGKGYSVLGITDLIGGLRMAKDGQKYLAAASVEDGISEDRRNVRFTMECLGEVENSE